VLEPLESRARWTQLALLATAVLDIVAVLADISEYRLLGTDFSDAEANATDDRQAAIGGAQFALLIVTAVLFIRWFKRAYENVDALGRIRRFGTGWAVGSWFVPILNLWRPKQIANDIWSASGWSPGGLMTLWWVLFVISNWVGGVAGRLLLQADTVEQLRSASTAYAIGDAVDIAAALLAIWVVRTITSSQMARAGTLELPT
jgi:uncharacterized protein DUF4328